MKIIFISEYFPYIDKKITGGAENRCYNLAKELSKKHDVTVITSWQNGQENNYKLENINVFKVGPNHKYSNINSNITRFLFSIAAYKKASKIKADIIDSQSFISSLPTYYSAKKQKAKAVLTIHENWIGKWIKTKGLITGTFGEIWERLSLSKDWDKIVSVSNITKKDLVKNGISPEKITTIYNGINIREYSTLKKYNEPTICSISRLTKQKKIDDLILAIKEIKNKIPDIKCIIIGQGPEKERLKQLVKDNNLENNIEFKGYLERAELLKELAKSHVFCIPSILEGFGIVLLESIASKTPYVCSDIEVFEEITKKYKGGLSFSKENYRDLADKLSQMIKNKKLLSEKSSEGYSLIKEYNWEKIASELENQYLKLIS